MHASAAGAPGALTFNPQQEAALNFGAQQAAAAGGGAGGGFVFGAPGAQHHDSMLE